MKLKMESENESKLKKHQKNSILVESEGIKCWTSKELPVSVWQKLKQNMPRQKHKNAWEAVQSKSTLLKIVCNKHHTVYIKKNFRSFKNENYIMINSS